MSSQQSSSSGAKRPSDQEIVAQFNGMKQELQSIAQKVGELEMEVDEHKLVIDTMKPMNNDRKCFRLVGGVLVERTVGEVLPALTTNFDGIKSIIDQLLQTYKKKEEEMNTFQKKYNIRVTRPGVGAN
ncbi:Cochaperone prefoldin complex subunit [Dimargaris cristalligena]|uniref:Prefoldin n=1 Tax=Dimargaris cristalligena TaxID=215637 RepID=A0A4P9ZSC0_9FUNG|nr:Cochaperone prefoldin complex subunit [Dimargaris cristalligena]RKP36305.1 Prefoldin [Dimargaris cristalligena]|eukprot:RKP36305.1 Prefoldin [Dimargaris cristalligena]